MSTILIGNGGSLLDRPRGKLIDTFDTVVRFNNFKLAGFEAFTGTKTTIWAVNQGILTGAYSGMVVKPDTALVEQTLIFPGGADPTKAHQKASQVIAHENIKGTHVVSIDLILQVYHEFSIPHWPSTGMLAINYFKPCCIVGFDHFAHQKNHYCDDDPSRPTHHDSSQELNYVNTLIGCGMVSLL
jgi:hypothetical protein